MIQYRGYIAKVEYDASVGLLHASVINSNAYPIANCEAADVQTLKKELRVSIDEYLASCEEDGVEPSKPFSGKLHLRLGTDLHQRVAISPSHRGMSINSWIKHVLENNTP